MGTYEDLKTAIQQVIRTNGNNEITGALLQQTLLSIVNSVGANAAFAGIATPNTNPGTADQNVYYLATEPGTYANFGGIEIAEGEAVILSNKTGNWVKETSGFATQQQLTELESDVIDVRLRGADNTQVVRYVHLVAGETYELHFLNNAWNVSNVAESGYKLYISHEVNGSDVTDAAYTINDAVPNKITINAVSCDNGNQYRIAVRANVGESVFMRLEKPLEIIDNNGSSLSIATIDGQTLRTTQHINPISFFYGKGETYSGFTPFEERRIVWGIKPNTKYRAEVLKDADMSGIIVDASKARFQIICVKIDGVETILAEQRLGEELLPYYDVTTPQDAHYLCIGGRCKEGDVVIVSFKEVTSVDVENVETEVDAWQPSAPYKLGSQVSYNGMLYRCVFPNENAIFDMAQWAEIPSSDIDKLQGNATSLIDGQELTDRVVYIAGIYNDSREAFEHGGQDALYIEYSTNQLRKALGIIDGLYRSKMVLWNKNCVYILNSEVFIYDGFELKKISCGNGIPSIKGLFIKPKMAYNGYIKNHGVVDSMSHCLTTPIYGDFHISLNAGYYVYSAALVDEDGKILIDEYLNPLNYDGFENWEQRTSWGTMALPQGYGVVLTIVRADGVNPLKDNNIISKFEWLKESDREIINEVGHIAAWQRSRQLQKVLWRPLSKLPSSFIYNNDYYKSNDKILGLPYSGAREYDKFVGVNVSLRTFMTALANRRSLLYTEDLRPGYYHSEYGISYHGDSEACTYYGCVCSAYVAYVIGNDMVYASNLTPQIAGMSKVNVVTGEELMPMDVIVRIGHVSIITDIIKDEYGKIKYVVWAEYAPPLPRLTPYTLSDFMDRLANDEGNAGASEVYRYSNLNNNTEVPNWSDLCEYRRDYYEQKPMAEPLISTFAGDYASFAKGDKIFLNARPMDRYTSIRLYKDSELYDTISIGGYAVDSNGYIDVDLTSKNLPDGQYYADLYDGTASAGNVYFEVIELNLSVTKSTLLKIDFSCVGGDIKCITRQNLQGISMAYHYPTSQEIANGTITEAWASSGTYVKIYAKGYYGMVSKRVEVL